MIVIGIDPAQDYFNAVALYLRRDGQIFMDTAEGHAERKTNRTMSLRSAMLAKLAVSADLLVESYRRLWNDPDDDDLIYVFVEEPPNVRNIRTLLLLAEAVGAIVAGLTRHTDKVYIVPVSSWKKSTCGSGNAGKPQVAAWLSTTHPNYAAACGPNQDLVDACCIALHGVTVVADAELVRTPGDL